MQFVSSSSFRLMLIAAVLAPAVSSADDAEKAFRESKANLIQQIKSPKPDVRLAAVKRFEKFPTPDAAKTLILHGLGSPQEDVRRASFETLLVFGREQAVCEAFQVDLLRDLKRDKIEPDGCVRLAVLTANDEPAAKAAAAAVIDQAEKTAGGMFLVNTVVDQFGDLGDETALKALLRLAELPLSGHHAGFRRALAQAFIKFRKPEAITALVAISATAEGELRAEINRHLSVVSGLPAADRMDWSEWWTAKQADFKFPSYEDLRRGKEKAADNRGPSYYGLPVYGSKIVFILDTSGSMRNGKLDAAKRELLSAIGDLPDGVQFGIVAFNSVVVPWQPKLVFTSAETRQRAAKFVNERQANATTASFDALEAALSYEPDAIFFLTDGEPHGGKHANPTEIVGIIGRINRVQRATIHTIGIGVGREGGGFDQFLRTLAGQNFGAYRRVD